MPSEVVQCVLGLDVELFAGRPDDLESHGVVVALIRFEAKFGDGSSAHEAADEGVPSFVSAQEGTETLIDESVHVVNFVFPSFGRWRL